MRRLAILAVVLGSTGCSDVVYHQARQPPSSGPTSHWLRVEDRDSYQTPWRRPALATDEDNQPHQREPCRAPGPGFPSQGLFGVTAAEDHEERLPASLVGHQRLDPDPVDPFGQASPTTMAGTTIEDQAVVTREPRGNPAIGGFDRRPEPYSGQNRGMPATAIASQRVADDDWCLATTPVATTAPSPGAAK